MAIFKEINKLNSFLKERMGNDIWTFPYVNELKVSGFDIPPMLRETMMEELKNNISSEEDINTALKEHGLFLSLPNREGTKMITAALTSSSLQSLYDRAGFSQSRTVSMVASKGKRKNAQATERAKILSFGLNLDQSSAKVLIRENKIATVRSEQYAIIPEYELVKKMEDELNQIYDSSQLYDSEVTYDFTVVDFATEKKSASQNLLKLLDATAVSTGIRLVTSDTGSSSVSLYPYIKFNKMGKNLSIMLQSHNMKHEGDANIECFSSLIDKAGNITKLVEDLDNLSKVKIHHPSDVLRNVCCELKFSKDSSLALAEEFGSLFPQTCSGVDIYSWLFELSPTSLVGNIKHIDRCLRVLSMDLSKKDYPFEWTN